MVNRLGKLRVGVQYFFWLHTLEKQEETFSCDEDQLTDKNWAEIERFIKLLAPFEYSNLSNLHCFVHDPHMYGIRVYTQ